VTIIVPLPRRPADITGRIADIFPGPARNLVENAVSAEGPAP
jgi:hypothetical protein